MYKVKVNQQYDFEIEAGHDALRVNGSPVVLDEQTLHDRCSHILYKNRSYTVETVSLDREEKQAVIKVNGTLYQVAVADQFDLLLKQLGMDNLAVNKVQQIKAPMPGLVLNVLVNDGDEVKTGDNLLVLEAMKMENMIKSPSDGTIKKINVVKGDKVEKNEVLIHF